MAHELTQRANGRYEFCFTGNRNAIWHGLGQELTEGESIDVWKRESGLDWEIFESTVQYQTAAGQAQFDDKKVLFRSDTNEALSVVGSAYHIVQPGEVLEFFSDLTSLHGYKLSAAGSVFGGKRFWATADIGKTFAANGDNDQVNGQLLLTSSADGTTSTIAKIVSTRVVCNNTLTVALSEGSKNIVKKSHKTEWNASAVKIDMGLIDESWEKFSTNIKKLAEVEITPEFVTSYLQKKFYNPEISIEDQTWGSIKRVNTLIGLYENGTGANLSQGTAWGLVNGITEMYTHGTKTKQDPSRRFWEGSFGTGDAMKSEVYSDMVELFA